MRNNNVPSLMQRAAWGARRVQRGVSLVFALMGLVVLTLGAVALLRSVDTGLLVLGNLGFKQDTLAASSVGAEAAIGWLRTSTTVTLSADQRAKGYSSVAITALEPTGPRSDAAPSAAVALVDWLDNSCVVPGVGSRPKTCIPALRLADMGTLKMQYFITRLCASPGLADSANDCVKPVATNYSGTSSQRGSLGYGFHARPSVPATGIYYRIITRVEDKRGTVSFTETLVQL